MRASLSCMLVLMSVSAALAEDFVWIEGESPSTKNFEFAVQGAQNGRFLSGETWLSINLDPANVEKECPKEGILLGYEFSAPSEGKYEIWNRIGFEFVRSPFEFRVDQGEWKTVSPQDLTCDLMELGFWCEVAWYKMGEAQLSAGKHIVQIRLTPRTKEDKGRQVFEKISYHSDALCIYRGEFRPNGRHKPGEAWQTEEDKKAAAQVYAVALPPGVAQRSETPLGGLWQVCRYDEQEVVDREGPARALPDAQRAYWMSIQVPGNKSEMRPELAFCHRLVYRTRVNVPAELAGRGFFLRLPSINMIGSVFVNGRFCGWTKAMNTLWECDVTPAVKPGQVNEICIVIKDFYYAISPKKTGKSCRMSFNVPRNVMHQNWMGQHFDFPVAGARLNERAGILEEPSFIVAGKVYATDVFAIPSVKKKELGLEVSILNPGPAEVKVEIANEVVLERELEVEKAFAPRQAVIAPGKEEVIKLAEKWENPKLWWPDDPRLYTVITTIKVDGKPVDVRKTNFGFREWDWSGTKFVLNGVPWLMWADCTANDGQKNALGTIALWRLHGQNMWRFWGESFGGLPPAKALGLMDRQGIFVRRSGIFDGQGANYLHGLIEQETRDGKKVNVANKALFDNWITQLKAQVKAERNHPSIFIWSMENEITFINSRNLGLHQAVEPEIARAAREVMALDPTRPAMVDGGNCLVDKSLPVNGVHYQEGFWRDYPDEAYTLANAYIAHEKAVIGWGKVLWELVKDRPIFMGEAYFVRGSNPAAYSQFAGEGCFTGWGPYTRQGAGLLAKMLAEGYRWHGVAAHHLWLGMEDATLHYNSWQPVCVLCREWNWTFGGGSEIARTLKLFNGTRHADPIEMAWEARVDGRAIAGEEKTYALAPGTEQEFQIKFTLPSVAKRTAGEFILTCKRGGREVFREVKTIAVIDPAAGPRPKLAKEQLAVLDPAGAVRERLAARGIEFTPIAKPDDVPANAKVIVIGKDALSARQATDPRWLSLAARGARLLVLDQQNPLHYQAVPADFTVTDCTGRIAFMENAQHSIFAGLAEADFLTWSKDHIVYRNAYRKATRGAVSLAHCDEQLSCSAIAQCPVNDGVMLLCQMVVGEKLAFDPVAQRLFDNMLAYCDSYAVARKSTAVVMAEDDPACRLLADSGLKFDRADNLLTAMEGGKHPIIVFRASAANLASLAAQPAKVKAFTSQGGWLMAWGVTADGLESFNQLVGVQHLLRPFELERVSLPALRDPLISGLTLRDVAMESAEKIFPWAGDKYLVDDEFTHIVDLDDIAPFAEFPGCPAGDGAAARKAGAGWARNVVNGFTSADAWKLIYYMEKGAAPRLSLKLPRPETIDGFSIVLNVHYAKATKVQLFFDNDPEPVSLETKPNSERQDFTIAPRKASSLRIELAEFEQPGKTTGIDNLWIHVRRGPEWQQKVKPLLNIGGLVKYPMGEGGIILNQLNARSSEPVPVNMQKKRVIASTLLRNLNATFSGGKILTASNLKFQPIPLNDQCNQYLTSDRGWFGGGRDISHLPIGETSLAGTTYLVRDFKTSPVPSCVMLAGPGAQGKLPREVTGLKVGCKADVLFFLHAFNQAAQWRGRRDEAPPVLFKYVVHYADGQTAEIPVIYGEGAAHWVSKDPGGLKNAAVAWAGAFPGDNSGEQAVAYQMQWTNPRPDATIESVDMVYGKDGSRFGTPALLAITAGTEIK